jgi:hypothetical protein
MTFRGSLTTTVQAWSEHASWHVFEFFEAVLRLRRPVGPPHRATLVVPFLRLLLLAFLVHHVADFHVDDEPAPKEPGVFE